ncbi:hypothetical protein Mag101_04825 [Microbulbifer agarilyticus]|uniref:Metallophosphoesterase n=1 Tax=Microbulbifer agarilyticus TaxID=260552 RepID=A0A1Q2M321_9GAMM|nr:metallophosphoesterase family protein [Microbulbifer agarilyticus]AQQ67039.1 hypothetical protein Mag101_04825 [Microbulbifer agarilyticus]
MRVYSLFFAALLGSFGVPSVAHFDARALQKIEVDAYRPSPVPDRILMSLSGDPATERAVNWRTDNNAQQARAQYTLADGGPDQEARAATVDAATEILETGEYRSFHHSVRFKSLRPSTQYIYRVGDGQVWSEWMQFRTASTEAEPFGFIYFGDAQNDLKSRWSRVARQAYTGMPKADFILHAGDLVNKPENDQEWGQWFYAAGWINGSTPSIATPGNHEYKDDKLAKQWRPHFTLPENGPDNALLAESVYFLDYQGTRFISLNSQSLSVDSEETALQQRDWLERVLSDNPNHWTVIFHHHPMMPATKRRTPHEGLNEYFKPLYEKFNVDLVLQGHDHSYARGENLSSGGTWLGQQSPVYVVSVSGPKMYDGGASWPKVAGRDLQLYQLIEVDQNRIRYRSYRADGVLFDQFVLEKDDKGRRRVE